jgi:hypothetical protein
LDKQAFKPTEFARVAFDREALSRTRAWCARSNAEQENITSTKRHEIRDLGDQARD